jgi:hypothetical protein
MKKLFFLFSLNIILFCGNILAMETTRVNNIQVPFTDKNFHVKEFIEQQKNEYCKTYKYSFKARETFVHTTKDKANKGIFYLIKGGSEFEASVTFPRVEKKDIGEGSEIVTRIIGPDKFATLNVDGKKAAMVTGELVNGKPKIDKNKNKKVLVWFGIIKE